MDETSSQIMKWNPEITNAAVLTIVGGFWAFITFLISRREAAFKKRLETIATIRQLNNDLKEWADEVTDVLSEVGHMCDLDPKRYHNFFNKRHELKVVLSALIDKGRFYLPNTNKIAYGQDKHIAFQGITRESISQMKECYRLLNEEINYFDQQPNIILRKQFMDIKRKFVSSIQKELNPQRYFIEIRNEFEKGI